MFRSARIKLTGWYLLIIMLISVVFSVGIYTAMTRELERGFRRVEIRAKAEKLGIPLPKQLPQHWEKINPQLKSGPLLFAEEDLKEAQKRIDEMKFGNQTAQ